MGCGTTHEKPNSKPNISPDDSSNLNEEEEKEITNSEKTDPIQIRKGNKKRSKKTPEGEEEEKELSQKSSKQLGSKNSKISSEKSNKSSSFNFPRKYMENISKEQQDEEFKNYQNEIKKKRIGEEESSSESDTSSQKRAKRKLGLYYQDVDEELEQLEKENKKRKGRMQFIRPLQKEKPFRHREKEKPYNPKKPDISKPFKLGYEDEIYNGNNYGIPIQIYNQTWLTYDFFVEPDVNNPKVQIPLGWKIPSKKDYEELIKFAGSNERAKIILTHEKLLNMNEDYDYITSDKCNNEFDGYKNQAWEFFCVCFNRDEEGNKGEKKNKVDGFDFMMNEQKNWEIDKGIISESDESENENKKKTDFEKDIKNKIKRNKNKKFSKINSNKINDKKRVKTPTLHSKIKYTKKDIELIFETNPESIFQVLEEENKNEKVDKLIYKLDTYQNKKTLRCKLIANKVLDIMFKCPLVIEQGYKAYFEVPQLTNITTFKWNFNDPNCKKKKKISDKLITSHIFNEKGEYLIELHIILFSCRSFHLEKKVLVIDEILYGEEEIINGISYGQPIKIGNQIWLDRDLKNYKNYKNETINLVRGKGPGIHGENSFLDSVSACPKGWRLPYKEEIEEMLNYVGNNNEQRLYFLTLMDGAFLADISESGLYDLICMNFKQDSNLFDGKEKEKINHVINSNYELNQKLKNYNRLLVGTLNFNDIYRKEAYCLNITNDKVSISTRTTSMNSPYSMFSTRCIIDQEINLDLGIIDTAFPVGFNIQFKLDYPNITQCFWDFGDDSDIISNQFEVTHSYNIPGEYNLNCNFTVFYEVNYTITKKLEIYGNDDDKEDTELIDENQIKIVNLGNLFKVKRINEVHFSHSIAPISPLIKELGFYISFNDLCDNQMKVFKIILDNTENSFLDQFKNPLYKYDNGIPYDIASTNNGLIILMGDTRDSNLLFIQYINSKGEMIWRNNIMSNGQNPLKPEKNQLLFFNPETDNIEFGMNAMFNPISGRLSYGYGRILCVFSYMNHFGLTREGEREDNNGDTVVTYSEDGTQVHLVQSWSTTHSLCQRCVYNGNYFFQCSLGDAAPANINLLRIDPKVKLKLDTKNKFSDSYKSSKFQGSFNSNNSKGSLNNNKNINKNNIYQPEIKFEHYFPLQNRIKSNQDLINTNNDFEFNEYDYLKNLENFKQSEHMTMNLRNEYIKCNIVKGSIPSNLKGQTSGRIGDITKIRNDKFALIYSRIPCVDGGEINKINELSCIIFNSELKIEKVNLIRDGDLINCIKQAKYGKNIFVMISETKKFTNDKKYIIDKVDLIDEEIDEEHEICNCFLLNSEGEIKGEDILSYPINIFSPSDDFESLIDGSVVWVFSDNDNNLYLCFLGVSNLKKEFLNNYKKEIVSAGKIVFQISKKDEEAILERKKKEKEILRSMGIDDEEIQRKIKESEKIEKYKHFKNSEERRLKEEEDRIKEEEEKKKIEEEEE